MSPPGLPLVLSLSGQGEVWRSPQPIQYDHSILIKCAYCIGWILGHNSYPGLWATVNFTTECFPGDPFGLSNGFAILCQGFVILRPVTVVRFWLIKKSSNVTSLSCQLLRAPTHSPGLGTGIYWIAVIVTLQHSVLKFQRWSVLTQYKSESYQVS